MGCGVAQRGDQREPASAVVGVEGSDDGEALRSSVDGVVHLLESDGILDAQDEGRYCIEDAKLCGSEGVRRARGEHARRE